VYAVPHREMPHLAVVAQERPHDPRNLLGSNAMWHFIVTSRIAENVSPDKTLVVAGVKQVRRATITLLQKIKILASQLSASSLCFRRRCHDENK